MLTWPKDRPRTIAIVGPTAAGKTAVGLELARRLEALAEIVSVDSVQVYRYMDIGAAKPTAAERTSVPFSMIDIVDPDQDFTVADYQAMATTRIAEIQDAGGIAMLVGGTGLYFRAITTVLSIPKTPPDEALRAHWQAVADAEGLAAVRAKLIEIDLRSAEKIHANDVRRMIRAIEVYEQTGRPLSEWHRENREQAEKDTTPKPYFCLNVERDTLYRGIERRVDAMIAAGFVDEVTRLRSMGYGPELKSMQSLGYRQLSSYLDGGVSLDDAIESIKSETRQFARRQLIWFRADKRLQWIDVAAGGVKAAAESILASINQSIN